MQRRTSSAGRLVLTIVAIVAAVDGSSHGLTAMGEKSAMRPAGSDQATLRVRVDEVERVSCSLVAQRSDDGFRFSGRHRLARERCVVSYEWQADLDPRGGARIAGWVDVHNETDFERSYELEIRFPLNPLVADRCRIGGTARLELMMDADGGRVGISPGDALWVALVDRDEVKSLHRGPFSMGAAAAGRAIADDSFGAPYPSFDAPSVEDGFGLRHRCRLTGGDRVVFRTDLRLTGEPDDFVRRRPSDPVRIAERDDRIVIDVTGHGNAKKVRRGTVIRSGSRRGAARRPVRVTSGGD